MTDAYSVSTKYELEAKAVVEPDLPASEVGSTLASLLAVDGLELRPRWAVVQQRRYLDRPEFSLARRGLCLMVEYPKPSRMKVRLKRLHERHGHFGVFEERTVTGPPLGIDGPCAFWWGAPLRPVADACREDGGSWFDLGLGRCVDVLSRRRFLTVRECASGRLPVALVALDDVTVVAEHRVVTTFREVELEGFRSTPEGMAALERVVQAVAQRWPVDLRSKYLRGVAALQRGDDGHG